MLTSSTAFYMDDYYQEEEKAMAAPKSMSKKKDKKECESISSITAPSTGGVMDSIVALQEPTGAWEKLNDVAKIAKKDLAKIKAALQQAGVPADALDAVAATLIAVWALRNMCADSKEQWKLIEMKAKRFIKGKGLDMNTLIAQV